MGAVGVAVAGDASGTSIHERLRKVRDAIVLTG
jgi:hypothetical protein